MSWTLAELVEAVTAEVRLQRQLDVAHCVLDVRMHEVHCATRVSCPLGPSLFVSTTLPFAERRKRDWISDVKSNKSRRRSAHAKYDRLWNSF